MLKTVRGFSCASKGTAGTNASKAMMNLFMSIYLRSPKVGISR
jgi:hypothetical protein